MTDNQSKTVNNFGHIEVPSRLHNVLLQLYMHKLDRSVDLCSYFILQRRMVAMAKISLLLPYYKRASKVQEIDCNEH